MKANAPEKLYIDSNDNLSDSILYAFTEMRKDGDIEYIRKDVFVERALKWYCLDCECNDGCKADCHCFFKEAFKQYLKGNEKALPPKIEDAINPDGSTSENYRYRHFIRRMQDAFIEKAAKLIEELDDAAYLGFDRDGCAYIGLKSLSKDFKKYMRGKL